MLKETALQVLHIDGEIPQDVRQISLSLLFITPGSLGKMHRSNVHNIDQFLNFPPSNLLLQQGIGLRTVSAILHEIRTLRDRGNLLNYHFNDGIIPEDPKVFTNQLIDKLEKEEGEVMIFRYGLGIPRKHTLAAIGQIKDITRERVRQRENKNLQYLYRIYGPYISEFINKLRQPNAPQFDDLTSRYLDFLVAVDDSPTAE